MFEIGIPVIAAWLNASVLTGASVVHLAGTRGLRALYAGWDVPTGFYVTIALLELVAAYFLITPELRFWGIAIAALIAFGSVVMLLDQGQYIFALPIVLFMLALVPAALAIPSSHEHIRYVASVGAGIS